MSPPHDRSNEERLLSSVRRGIDRSTDVAAVVCYCIVVLAAVAVIGGFDDDLGVAGVVLCGLVLAAIGTVLGSWRARRN
jgi:hypothetical protein